MIELVAKTVFELVTGNLGAIKATLLGWVEKLKGAWTGRDKIADDFMRKWESDDAWTRGTFQGEVLGWAMMTALLILATAGSSSLAAATGKWAVVLRTLRTVDALGDITSYLGQAARLPGKAAAILRSKFGKGATEASKLAEGALEAESDAARAVSHADEAIEIAHPRADHGTGQVVQHADHLGSDLARRSVHLLGQQHTLRAVDRGSGVVSLLLCSDCGFVLHEIDDILAQTSTKGPTRSLRRRLEHLRSKVADLEAELASGEIKHTKSVAELDQIAAHLGEISKKFPSANPLCVFCAFKAQVDYDKLAQSLGYKRTNPGLTDSRSIRTATTLSRPMWTDTMAASGRKPLATPGTFATEHRAMEPSMRISHLWSADESR